MAVGVRLHTSGVEGTEEHLKDTVLLVDDGPV